MKITDFICDVILAILIIVLPLIFALNGLGVDTWQWWALSVGILVSNIIGFIEGKKIRGEDE